MYNTIFQGLIQGITEFLPISSSGHLVIFNTIFGDGESNLSLTVCLHFATLLSVFIVFRKDIFSLIKEFFGAISDLLKGRKDCFKTPERRFLLMVIIGTIPALIAGLGVKLLELDSLMENIFTVAVMLLVTATFMFLIDRLKTGTYTEADAPYKTTLLVGCLQAAAILPGLSRSGSTIFGGVLGGLNREFAVKYAFILSIPAILGAGVLEFMDVLEAGSLGIDPFHLFVGFIVAAVSGVASIKLISLLIRNRKFYIFGIYCLLAAGIAFWAGTRYSLLT
ncbi:MAG: undecaprenyl-diphosphate phosphatase [Oscillospiraceae bacterium]|nr:undecaprenyl-diphosphate phosphatase [Oscillospiraceae bacterium]